MFAILVRASDVVGEITALLQRFDGVYCDLFAERRQVLCLCSKCTASVDDPVSLLGDATAQSRR